MLNVPSACLGTAEVGNRRGFSYLTKFPCSSLCPVTSRIPALSERSTSLKSKPLAMQSGHRSRSLSHRVQTAPGADCDRDVVAPFAVAPCPGTAVSIRLPTHGPDRSLGAPGGHGVGLLCARDHQALPPGELSHSYTRVEAQKGLGLVLPATPVDRRQCHAKKDSGDELGGLSQNGSMPPAVPTTLFKSHEDPSQPTYSHVR